MSKLIVVPALTQFGHTTEFYKSTDHNRSRM